MCYRKKDRFMLLWNKESQREKGYFSIVKYESPCGKERMRMNHLQERKRWEWIIIFKKRRDGNELSSRKEEMRMNHFLERKDWESACGNKVMRRNHCVARKYNVKFPLLQRRDEKDSYCVKEGWERFTACDNNGWKYSPCHAWKGWEGFSLWQWMDKEDSPFYQRKEW